jgi:hypothetical protein
MKNLHVLPTDKPSRLRIGDNGNVVLGLIQDSIVSKNDNYNNQHIYITSDEEIKESDWYLYMSQVMRRFSKNPLAEYPYPKYQKIILTNDMSLIKEGVQPIDDDFLEWFAKNPSCEYVEVELLQAYKLDGELGDFMYKTDSTKQNIDNTMRNNDTLEFGLMEIELKNTKRILGSLEKSLEDRDKKIEKMYSEEEVYTILVEHTIELFKKEPCTLDEWFEKNKKK